MLHSRSVRLIAGVLMMLALAGCSQSASTAVSTPTTVVSVTPTDPVGDYAFIRQGDVWVHLGNAPSHPLTQLHLGLASAEWGSLSWSPDHATLAFVLNAPPIAPGFTAQNPLQSTGTLFLVDVASGKLTAVPGAGAVPIQGRHVAWTTSAGQPTIIFTQNGVVSLFTPGQTKATPLHEATNVWEVVIRGSTLFYSTATNIQPTGGAIGELHSLNLTTATDVKLAQLGKLTLPASLCSSLICPPDAATPAVPFAWSVSGDGTVVAYESNVASTPVAGATPTPGGPVTTPAPTATVQKLSVLAPMTTPPPVTSHFFVLRRDGGASQAIFTQIPAPPSVVTWGLGVSPDGQYVALSVATPSLMEYGPFLQSLGANGDEQTIPAAGQKIGGIPNWAPTSGGFTLTSVSTASGPQDPSLVTFLVGGQRLLTELIGDDLVWGE